MSTKVCLYCKTEKPLDAFERWRKGIQGVRAGCLQCAREPMQFEFSLGPIDETPRYKHQREVFRKYGLKPRDYEDMLRDQLGRCAICRIPESAAKVKGWTRPFCVDHDHDTGKVRGLLCTGCNLRLGLCHNKPSEGSAAHLYLERHAAKQQRKPITKSTINIPTLTI